MTSETEYARRQQHFERIEREHDLFSHRVDGWSTWRVLRNPVHRLVTGLKMAPVVRSEARRSARALGTTFKLLWVLAAGRRSDLLVKTCRSALRMSLGAQYRDVYFDGLLQRGYTCLKLEEVNSPDYAAQARAAAWPADIDSVVFTFWGRVLGTLLPVRVAKPFCERVALLLKEELGVAVRPGWLLTRVSTMFWQIRLYSMLLARVRPVAVLVADTGEYALRVASFRQKARFIELQHGVFDGSHPDAVPSWVQGTDAELILPDVLASRGEYWINQLSATRQGRDHAIAVGNELVDIARRRRERRGASGVLHLVLSTQGLDSERLAGWIGEMIAAAPESTDWNLTIKLHPLYDVRTTAFDSLAGNARVRIVRGADDPNVFDLLADADLHLSIASACHFDAAALGVPSVVIPLAGHEAMLAVVDDSSFFLAGDPAAAWRVVTEVEPDQSRAYRFATPQFLDNFERLVT